MARLLSGTFSDWPVPKLSLNPHAVGTRNFELLSKLFANIFHHPNFIYKHKLQYLDFFAELNYYDFRINHTLIVNIITIFRVL